MTADDSADEIDEPPTEVAWGAFGRHAPLGDTNAGRTRLLRPFVRESSISSASSMSSTGRIAGTFPDRLLQIPLLSHPFPATITTLPRECSATLRQPLRNKRLSTTIFSQGTKLCPKTPRKKDRFSSTSSSPARTGLTIRHTKSSISFVQTKEIFMFTILLMEIVRWIFATTNLNPSIWF